MSTKSDLMESYWIEFLRWVKKFNEETEANNKIALGEYFYEKDASEINFWHWYIDTKLTKEEHS